MLADVRTDGRESAGRVIGGGNPRWGLQTPATAAYLVELEEGLERLGFTEVELTAYLVDIDGLPASEVRRIAETVVGDNGLWWTLSDGCFVAVFMAPVRDTGFMTRAVERCLDDAARRMGAFGGEARALVRGLKRWSYEVLLPGLLLQDIQASPADLVRARMPTAA